MFWLGGSSYTLLPTTLWSLPAACPCPERTMTSAFRISALPGFILSVTGTQWPGIAFPSHKQGFGFASRQLGSVFWMLMVSYFLSPNSLRISRSLCTWESLRGHLHLTVRLHNVELRKCQSYFIRPFLLTSFIAIPPQQIHRFIDSQPREIFRLC